MTSSSSDDDYKSSAVRQEKFNIPPAHYGTDTESYDTTEEKSLIRKIDWRLLPILGALYSISLVSTSWHRSHVLLLRNKQIDRTNIANARVAGMGTGLALNVGDRYTIAFVMFFPIYFLFELPSKIVFSKVGSANWLAFIAFSWDAVTIGQDERSSSMAREYLVCTDSDRCYQLAETYCLSCITWILRSGILSRLCLPDHVLVQEERNTKAVSAF